MQQLLIKLGIGRLAQYGATGNFLDVTLEAVKLFQDEPPATRRFDGGRWRVRTHHVGLAHLPRGLTRNASRRDHRPGLR
jgi:hypothetical protein